MERRRYRKYVDEMTELIHLGRSLGADISDGERIFKESLSLIANGNDLKGMQAAKSAKAMVQGPIRLVLESQLVQMMPDLDAATREGYLTDEASGHVRSSRKYLKEWKLKDAARYNQLAIDALAKAQTKQQSINEQLEFTGWMLDTLAIFETVPSHLTDIHEGSLKSLDDGHFEKALELDRIVTDGMEERLWYFMDEMLDRAQMRVIAMRERETDPARISLHSRSAADYLEMARRRHDRGTADDMTVALEYLRELETRFGGDL